MLKLNIANYVNYYLKIHCLEVNNRLLHQITSEGLFLENTT